MSSSASGVFDSTETFDYLFVVSEKVYVIVQTAWWLRFREFWAPATTVSSGGSSSPTTASGGSSTPTTSSDASDTAINSATHAHVETGGTTGPNISSHYHALSHDHTVTIGSHQHSVTVGPHSHDLEFGIFKEPMPGSIDVNVGIWRKDFGGGAWALEGSVSGLDETEVWLDLSQWVDRSGLWRLTFQSAAGAPQGGRLTVDVAHDSWGAIKSA